MYQSLLTETLCVHFELFLIRALLEATIPYLYFTNEKPGLCDVIHLSEVTERGSRTDIRYLRPHLTDVPTSEHWMEGQAVIARDFPGKVEVGSVVFSGLL